jgi:hypothetical protein
MDLRLRGPEKSAELLRSWLTGARGLLAGMEVENPTIPSGTGASNETVLFEATWSGPTGPERHELVPGSRRRPTWSSPRTPSRCSTT